MPDKIHFSIKLLRASWPEWNKKMKTHNGYFSEAVGIIKWFDNKALKFPTAIKALCISHSKMCQTSNDKNIFPQNLFEKKYTQALHKISFVKYCYFYCAPIKSFNEIHSTDIKKKEFKATTRIVINEMQYLPQYQTFKMPVVKWIVT